VKNTLNMQLTSKSKPIPSWVFGLLVVGVFIGVTGLAMLLGRWQNGISKEEYLRRIQTIDSPVYHHNRGEVAPYGPND
jgi:hypothetical protein